MNVFKKISSRLKARHQNRPATRPERKQMRKEHHQAHLARIEAMHERFYNDPRVKFMSKFSLLFHGILACVLILVIETCSRHSLTSAVSFVVQSPLTFLYNALLIFATLLIVYLFKRRMLIRLIITIFWILLGAINGIVLASRVTPFNFTDLKLIGDLLDMKSSKYVSTGEVIVIIVCLVLVLALLVRIAMRGPKFMGKIHRFRNLAGLIVCVAIIPFITKAAIHSDILAGYFGNLAQGYQDYGFVYSFSASVVDTGMSKPGNYSQAKINKILDHESDQASTVDQSDAPNIIFIQLESFIDPYEVKYLNMSEDPIPNFHKLLKNYTSGYLTVPVVGAGTCNTEFEALTGMSIEYFGLGEYPYKTVLKDQQVESSANALENVGYATHVLHNNGGNFYGRANIFNEMGFDTFTSKELMDIKDYNEIHSWAKDEILVDETSKILDSTPDQSDYIYTITVQSHGSYPSYDVFTDPDSITVTGCPTQEQNYQWEYYVNELHQVDQMIGDLLEELEQRDEKTLVVMYGDHLPTMGLEDSDMNNGSIFETTYATWNNFGMDKKDTDLTSYQIFAYFTDLLGIHEGTIFKYHQTRMDNDTTQKASYMNQLELLQYDLLYGKQYAYEGEQPFSNDHMTMGVENVVIKNISDYPDIVPDEPDKIQITGKNFTPWSYVFVNGEKVSTQYVSSNCLLISREDLSDGAMVLVKQLGSSNTVFRVSNPYEIISAEKLTGKKLKNTNSNIFGQIEEDEKETEAATTTAAAANTPELKSATDNKQ